MHTIRYTLTIFSLATLLLLVNGCDSSDASIKSTLQIMGLNEGAFIEGDSTTNTLYFTYNFRKNGMLNIHQLSTSDYESDKFTTPIENNVGEFGLFALAHAQSQADPIVEGDIKFTLVGVCGSQPLNIHNYGNAPTFADENGRKTIDLSRNLKLPEFVSHMHNQLNERNAACYSLDEMEEDPSVLEKNNITLRMDIAFQLKTKSGASEKKEFKLYFKPSPPSL